MFKYALEHADARYAFGCYSDGKPCLTLIEQPNLHELYLQAIPAAVDILLQKEELDISQIKVVLPPQITPEINRRLANVLGIEPQRIVDLATEGEDLYTSSLAYSMEYVLQHGLASAGDIGLIINVTSGIQVGCATYYF